MEKAQNFRSGSYCKVYVKNRTGSLMNPLIFNKPGWIEGVVIHAGAKRTRVDVGRKEIVKRNQFVSAH